MRNPRARRSARAERTSAAAVAARRNEGDDLGCPDRGRPPGQRLRQEGPDDPAPTRRQPIGRSPTNLQERSRATQRPERSTWPVRPHGAPRRPGASAANRGSAGRRPGARRPAPRAGRARRERPNRSWPVLALHDLRAFTRAGRPGRTHLPGAESARQAPRRRFRAGPDPSCRAGPSRTRRGSAERRRAAPAPEQGRLTNRQCFTNDQRTSGGGYRGLTAGRGLPTPARQIDRKP